MRLILLVFVVLALYPENGYAAKKVLLSSVKTLTLHSDKFTTGRRSSPIPQLQCVDGKSSCKSLPSAVQCYNMGSDGFDVQWKCEAQLPNNAQFDTLQVQCEGYDYPDDPYILAGSCGLTYTLKPVGGGSSGSSRSHKHHRRHSSSQSHDGAGGSGYSNFAVVAVFLVAGYAVYAFCLAPRARDATQSGGRQPSAPGYYGDDDADTQPPPPPYSESDQHRSPPQYGFRSEYTDTSRAGGASKYAYNAPPQPQQQQQQQAAPPQAAPESSSGRPGFWTGAALGGVAGYLFGNSGSSSRGGGGGGYRRDDYFDNQRPCYQDNSGGGGATYSSTSSSASDESPVTRTGYSSTRRR